MLYENFLKIAQVVWSCLNPYYNGICSMSMGKKFINKFCEVLILIIMEYAL